MKRRTLALVVAIATFSIGVAVARIAIKQRVSKPPSNTPPKENNSLTNSYTLTGPFSHENLTIFLIHGPDQPNSKLFVPLQEAMERKLVTVHETSDVNELSIENVSRIEEVFVQAGDIVKGGQQDRVLAVDLIVPSRSGKTPIDAFCVEHGRWEQRGDESVAKFDSSSGMLATKSLKMAARQSQSQTQVWEKVAEAQEDMRRSVETDVLSDASPSSLQLALENEKVQESASAYTKKLASIVDEKTDVIGYVFAINGKLNSADVYSSSALFKRFWSKLLKTTAIEAVTARAGDQNAEPVSLNMVQDFLASAERGKDSTRDITERTRMIRRESEKGLFFETQDMKQGGAWIHRNYLAIGSKG